MKRCEKEVVRAPGKQIQVSCALRGEAAKKTQ